LLVFAASPVAAQSGEPDPCGSLPEQLQAIQDFLTQVQQVGMAIGFSLAAVLLVYSGLLWMSGRPEKQEKARKIFVNVFVGLLIIVLASGLVEWVKMTLCSGAA
jgi:microcystin degradation protein MlrC